MKNEDKYSVFLLVHNKDRQCICDNTKSIFKARNIALKIKEKPFRKIEIEKNNKILPGGKYALDKFVYENWLKNENKENK